jgi:hypothetical protein
MNAILSFIHLPIIYFIRLKFISTTVTTLLPSFLKQKFMHQKIGLCGLYVAVRTIVQVTPDKGGSSVLMFGEEVHQ